MSHKRTLETLPSVVGDPHNISTFVNICHQIDALNVEIAKAFFTSQVFLNVFIPYHTIPCHTIGGQITLAWSADDRLNVQVHSLPCSLPKARFMLVGMTVVLVTLHCVVNQEESLFISSITRLAYNISI